MSAEAIVFFLAGLIQPWLQEILLGHKIEGRAATIVTFVLSAILALGGTWATGGFAGGKVPEFSLADPSPLLGFIVAKMAPVYALSQVVFGLFTRPIHAVAGTPTTA